MIRTIAGHAVKLSTSKTARSLYWMFSGNFLTIILTFFTTILIANHVTKAENGIFLALLTLANLLSDLGEAGLGSALSNFIPGLVLEKKTQQATSFVATAFKLELGIGIVLFVGLILGAGPIAHILFADTAPVHVMLTGAVTLVLVLFGFSVFTLSAYKQFREVSVSSILYSLIRLGLVILLVVTQKMTMVSLLLVYFLGWLSGWFYSLLFLKTGFLFAPFVKPRATELVKFASFLAIQKIFVSISSRLDLLMMVPLASAVAAGIYGIGSRFALVYPLVISSLGQVLAPNFAEYGSGKDALGFLRKAGMVVGFLLFTELLFYVSAPFIMQLLVPKYPEAIPVFRGLLVAMVGFVIATPFVSFIIYTLKKPFVMTITSFIQLAIIFVSNWIFIPRFHELGPVIGIGLGNTVVCIITICATYYYLRKERYAHRY